MSKIELGSLVEDQITGFKGRAVSRVEYITGRVQYGIVPVMTEGGAMPVTEYVDEQRLVVVGAPIAQASRPTGGPQRDAPRR